MATSNGTPCLLFCENSRSIYKWEFASIILDGAKLCIPSEEAIDERLPIGISVR